MEEMRVEKIKRRAQSRPPKSFNFHKRHDLEDGAPNEPPNMEEKFTLHRKWGYRKYAVAVVTAV